MTSVDSTAMPRARILIVDDELYVRRALQRVLSHHDVVLAADGSEAVACLQSQSFDAILCDLILPTMSGMEVYRHACKHTPDNAQRFIFLTGGSLDRKTDDFLAEVKNPVLEKPFDTKRMRELVDQVIGRHRDLA